MLLTRMYLPSCTLGRLEAFGFKCFTLELPWLNNARNISCIPEGIYRYRIAMSPRRKTDVIWIDGVDNRTAIQIHEANFTTQIEGCVAVGDGIRDINTDGVPDVTNSVDTFKRLLRSIPPTGTITIRGSSIETVVATK